MPKDIMQQLSPAAHQQLARLQHEADWFGRFFQRRAEKIVSNDLGPQALKDINDG